MAMCSVVFMCIHAGHTWQGCVVLHAPELYQEGVGPVVLALCEETGNHYSMVGPVTHCTGGGAGAGRERIDKLEVTCRDTTTHDIVEGWG